MSGSGLSCFWTQIHKGNEKGARDASFCKLVQTQELDARNSAGWCERFQVRRLGQVMLGQVTVKGAVTQWYYWRAKSPSIFWKIPFRVMAILYQQRLAGYVWNLNDSMVEALSCVTPHGEHKVWATDELPVYTADTSWKISGKKKQWIVECVREG